MARLSPSRYNEQSYVNVFPEGYSVIDNKFMEFVKRQPFSFYTIPKDQAYRIDLISNAIYGRTDMYWIIWNLNSFLNIENINFNRSIKFVNLNNVEEAYLNYRDFLKK